MTKKLIPLFALVFVIMFGTTVYASLQESLFEVLPAYLKMPWMQATLVDFYLNQFVIWLFILQLEKNIFMRIFWAIFFFCTGSMGSAIAVIFYIIKYKGILITGKGIKND